jgi:hypothetical protein
MEIVLSDHIAWSKFVSMLIRVNGGQFLVKRAATSYASFVGEAELRVRRAKNSRFQRKLTFAAQHRNGKGWSTTAEIADRQQLTN